MDAVPPPSRAPTSKRRWVLRGLLITVTLIWILVLLNSARRDGGERIGDAQFIRAAETVCKEAGAKINDRKPPGADASLEERAASVERVAGHLTDMARKLRALSVDGADAASVDRWLDELDAFNAVGRRYAAAIRSGDERRAERVGNEGDAPSGTFNATARANDIDNCVLG